MYKLIFNNITNKPDMVLIVGTNTYIPFDSRNTDYQQYLAWLAEGNEPEPADEQ